MDQDTAIGGPGGRFPDTRRSAVFGTRSADAATRAWAFDVLVAAYWKPVYKYVRLKWRLSNEDAKDLTQGFFTRAIEKDSFRNYDPAKASFRTFLRTCLDGFLANEWKAAHRIKRGGEVEMLSLDFEDAERELREHPVSDGKNLEDYFHEEWVRGLLARAVEALRTECEQRGKSVQFRIFERYDLAESDAMTTYQELAAEFRIPVTSVTNYLAWARREFRRILLDTLRELTADEREFQNEARLLLGGGAP